MREKTLSEKLIKMARKRGVIRVKDVRDRGIHPETLRRLYHEGIFDRVGWGLYSLSDRDSGEHISLIQAARQVPKGVVCLLSALQFHGIGTQFSPNVWMAIERRSMKPRSKHLPLKLVRFSGPALTEGVEEHKIEGVQVKVYNVAKTLADCFKYRNKIGLEIGLEALRECRRDRRCSMDEIWKYAKICRVSNVMRPYLEATA